MSPHRTDALLLRLSLAVGREVFYAALWGSVLASPAIRLPASLFVVGHISRDLPGKEQKYMLGTDYQLTVGTRSPWAGHRWGTVVHMGAGRARQRQELAMGVMRVSGKICAFRSLTPNKGSALR